MRDRLDGIWWGLMHSHVSCQTSNRRDHQQTLSGLFPKTHTHTPSNLKRALSQADQDTHIQIYDLFPVSKEWWQLRLGEGVVSPGDDHDHGHHHALHFPASFGALLCSSWLGGPAFFFSCFFLGGSVSVNSLSLQVFITIYIYRYTYIYIYIHLHVCMHSRMYACTDVCTHACLHLVAKHSTYALFNKWRIIYMYI